MKRLIFLIVISLFLLSGCTSNNEIEITHSRIPTYTVFLKKYIYAFDNNISDNKKIYGIENQKLPSELVQRNIGDTGEAYYYGDFVLFSNVYVYTFSNTMDYANRIYSITDQSVSSNLIEKNVGKIKRANIKEAYLDGDFVFNITKISKLNKSLVYGTKPNIGFVPVFNDIKSIKGYGSKIFKIKGVNTTDAIAIRFANNDFRKYICIGEISSPYKIINAIIKPIIFVPVLLLMVIPFLIYIFFFD